jgi:outer membrane lipoprotein-sorting protein
MKPRSLPAIAAVLVLFSVTMPDRGEGAADPNEIMARNFLASRVAGSLSDATFTLINKAGERRVRKVLGATKLRANGADNMRMTRFLSPPDIKGTVTLLLENSGKDDDMWIYLPALKKVRRLVANNKRDSFVGTDFSYGDVIGHKVEEWNHTLLREETLQGRPCYVIESVPKTDTVKANSGYSRRVTWIDAENFVALKGETWDEAGQPFKQVQFVEVQLVDPEHKKWQAMRMEAVNVQTGHRTLIRFENFKVDAQLPEDFFTTRYMEKES